MSKKNHKGKRPVYNTSGFSKDTLARIEQMTRAPGSNPNRSATNDKIKTVSDSSGLMNTPPIEPKINFVQAQGDAVMGSDSSCQIVFGRDRPSSLPSGYGGIGATGAHAIDIVVGRVSSAELDDGTSADPSIAGDAARIYISQLTDIDLNFGLAAGQSGNLKGISGIGIKADAVRIIGRRGVKIISGRAFAFKSTGRDGEKDSRGNSIKEPSPPIELIAGNYDSTIPSNPLKGESTINSLQGVAMGENTSEALAALSQTVADLQGAVLRLSLLQTVYISANSIDYMRPWMGAIGARSAQEYVDKVISSIWHGKVNNILWQVNFTKPWGKKWVSSRNVFST